MSKLIWKPDEERIKKTNLSRYLKFLDHKYGQQFKSYDALYDLTLQAAKLEKDGLSYKEAIDTLLKKHKKGK